MMKKKAFLAVLASSGMLIATMAPAVYAAQGAQSNTFTTIDEYHSITAGAPMNPFNSSGNTFNGFDQMQLGWFTNSATNSDDFIPGLASKWQIAAGGTVVNVQLQPGAKWSNGKPVTAKDVVASMAVAFTQGNAQSFFLGSVKAITPTEVQFRQVPGQHYNQFFNNLMQQTIVPSFEYGALMPRNIWTIINESQYTGTSAALKTLASKTQAQLTTIGKKITTFAPANDVSAGPFVLKRLNPGEAFLVKNPYFYATKKVKVQNVVFRNYTGNQQIWNYMISGQLDQAPFTAMPSNILDQILRTSGNKKVVTPSFVGAALAFNQGIYPYNMIAVRQALAHIINRNAVQKIAEPVVGTVSQYSDGMVDAATPQWLSSTQAKSLNPYSYNVQLATQELEKVGFKLVNGNWMMPNGKPWTSSIYTVNGFSDWIEAAKVISSEMTSFGIPTQPNIVSSYSQYLQELAQDKFALSFWINALGPQSYSTYQRIFGSNDGYQIVGGKLVHYLYSDKTKGNWLDIPQVISLGHGKNVNPGQLTYSLNHMTAAQQRPVVAELAAAANADLPMITLWNYINVQFVNTSRFTDFPLQNVGLLNNSAGVWMAQGYVNPVS